MKGGINEAFADLGRREADVEIEFEARAKKEAIATDANVNYVAKSANFYDFEGGYDGKFLLAGSIMSNPYLYSLIRAQGGAYGAGMFVSRSMLLATYSYRDPNISSTIDSFNKIGQIAKDLEMTDRDFENQKISSMGTILRPRNPKQMGDADYAYFRIPSSKKEDDILAEIKAASLDDIKALSDSFDKAMDLDNLVVFGARSDIEKNKDLFDEIKDLK